jgi:trk system potassium uptake protein TrkA
MRLIIIGCGRWGSTLARVLAQKGHDLTVIDQDVENFERLGAAFKGCTIEGVGFDRTVLVSAGIERADGLAAATASDETNVVAARIAREIFKVPRVVARVYDPRKSEMYRRLGLYTITPSIWGVNRMAELLCYSHLDAVASLGNGEVDILESEIPPLLAGRSVNEITLPGEIHVVAISRGGRTFLPVLGARFEAGDLVHVSVLTSSMERLKTMLGME